MQSMITLMPTVQYIEYKSRITLSGSQIAGLSYTEWPYDTQTPENDVWKVDKLDLNSMDFHCQNACNTHL